MTRYSIVLILCILSLNILLGISKVQASSQDKLALRVGYFGEFVMHPGITSGIAYTLKKNNWHELYFDTEIGAYWHKWNNNSFWLQPSIGNRFTSSFKGTLDLRLGYGYMLSSPNGSNFSVDAGGDLNSNNRPIYSHWRPGLTILAGWSNIESIDFPIIAQVGLESYLQSRFNHSSLPHLALRLELIYFLKN